MLWYLYEYIEDINRIKEMYKGLKQAIDINHYVISEEEYHASCAKLPKTCNVPPYDYYREKEWNNYYIYKYNVLAMTIIMIYCTWEKQKNKYNLDANINLTETAKINELKDLHNALKHGPGRSEINLRSNYPDYFKNTEETEGIVYLRLNISHEKVDEFADEIVSVWDSEIKKVNNRIIYKYDK